MKKTPPNPTPKKPLKELQAYTRYSGVAFQMAILIGLAVWAGIWLDRQVKIDFPIFTVSFALISCVGAMVVLIKSLPKY